MNFKPLRVGGFLFFWTFSLAGFGQELEEWLRLNEPQVRNYLQSLRKAPREKVVSGVRLSDGKWFLKGFRFLGDASRRKDGVQAFRFRDESGPSKYDVYVLWQEKGYQPHSLSSFPRCDGAWIEPGGIAVLSGDEYTYDALQPGGNVVVTWCKPQPRKSN